MVSVILHQLFYSKNEIRRKEFIKKMDGFEIGEKPYPLKSLEWRVVRKRRLEVTVSTVSSSRTTDLSTS